MPNIPSKPIVQNQEWINGETKLNQTNLTAGVNANISNLKAAVDGLIDALGGGGGRFLCQLQNNVFDLCAAERAEG